jgi:hypothetical protein
MLLNPRFFPTILIVLDVLAAVVYFSQGDMRKTVYWIAAAILTVTVVY